MGLYEKILADKVICEEVFYIQVHETDIKIGDLAVPSDSILEGTVEIAVLECAPIVDIENDAINARVVFLIQKELAVRIQAGQKIPLEFTFRVTKLLHFKKCTPSKLRKIDSCLLDDLECRVIYVSATDIVTLHPSDPASAANATFDEELNIKIKLKLVQQKQLTLRLCSPRRSTAIRVNSKTAQI